MKVSEILELLKRDGWYVARMRGSHRQSPAVTGSHRQFKHPAKAGLVTVAGKPGDDLAPGTLNSILKQAGLKK
jgi:predicted RNA binding protein YcfA (HicA-like mRNA interferase family)